MSHNVIDYNTSCASSLLFVMSLTIMTHVIHYDSWLIMWLILVTHPVIQIDSSCDNMSHHITHDNNLWLIMTHDSLCESSWWLIMCFVNMLHPGKSSSDTPWFIMWFIINLPGTHHATHAHDTMMSLPVYQFPVCHLQVYKFTNFQFATCKFTSFQFATCKFTSFHFPTCKCTSFQLPLVSLQFHVKSELPHQACKSPMGFQSWLSMCSLYQRTS